MKRRDFITRLAALGGLSSLGLSVLAAEDKLGSLGLPASHWQTYLNKAQFAVLFHEDTERPFSHPLNEEKREGTFLCAACLNPLFSSETKYDSGTGWPSFFRPISEEALGTKTDYKLLLPRTEYHCARCGGHQGHVFKDGPKPTGLRYCNNGLALSFIPRGKALPELRS